MNLSYIKILFILIAIFYFLLPIDLIPDLAPILGRLDDLGVIAFLIWKYYSMISKSKNTYQKIKEDDSKQKTSDPYEILNVSKDTSLKEIKKKFHKEIALYHPDKVSHLGKELQDFANQKTVEIQSAYDEISKKFS